MRLFLWFSNTVSTREEKNHQYSNLSHLMLVEIRTMRVLALDVNNVIIAIHFFSPNSSRTIEVVKRIISFFINWCCSRGRSCSSSCCCGRSIIFLLLFVSLVPFSTSPDGFWGIFYFVCKEISILVPKYLKLSLDVVYQNAINLEYLITV